MVRTQVQLTEQQVNALKARAVAEGLSMAELILRSVDAFLRSKAPLGREEKKRRAAIKRQIKFKSKEMEVSIRADNKRNDAAAAEVVEIVLKLDREDLDRLIEILRESGWSWDLYFALVRRCLTYNQRAALGAEMSDG